MGLSYESASSILCAEDSSSILCLEEEDADEPPQETSGGPNADVIFFFPLQSDEWLGLMAAKESEHMPREDYGDRLTTGSLDISIRSNAIDWIFKVHSHYGFGPLTASLSVNYLDRFFSCYQLPPGKAWMTRLLAVACLSLAAKMEETDVPLSLDLQDCESKYAFQARTVQRMELLVLSTLKWRMQAVTPFSFIDYFLHQLNEDNPPTNLLVSRSAELILDTTKGIDFLTFRPSEIAAAVAMSAIGESQTLEAEKAIDCCKHVDKERVLRCYEVMQEVLLMRNMHAHNGSQSASHSPNGVLDAAACLSYKSDGLNAAGSHENPHRSPASKRRKISRAYLQ